MLNCEDCIKNDVCMKKDELNELWERVKLSSDFQSLANNGSVISIKCNSFSEKPQYIELRGEQL